MLFRSYALQFYTTKTRTQAVIVGNEDDYYEARSNEVLMNYVRSSRMKSCTSESSRMAHLALKYTMHALCAKRLSNGRELVHQVIGHLACCKVVP